MTGTSYDIAIVGMGIVGLAHAYWSARAGKRVIVFDRDARATGASIRNFGFVTVTGQSAHPMWHLAKRSRDVWASIAPALSTPIQHYGLCMTAQREEAAAVLQAFAETDMGAQCELLEADEVCKRYPGLRLGTAKLCLLSPYELRVEAPKALPALATYLQKEWDVTIQTHTSVHGVADSRVETSAATFEAEYTIVCPGADFSTLYSERMRTRHLKKCKLQMLRLADPGFRLPFAVQSDLSLVRYQGYAALPQAAPLLGVLKNEQEGYLDRGIHLIVVQNADGSLVVGDSHHYSDAPTPFYDTETEDLILAEFERMFGLKAPPVIERWTGVYPYGDDPYFVEAPSPKTRLVAVTCGAGMSTAFAIAENTVHDLLRTTE